MFMWCNDWVCSDWTLDVVFMVRAGKVRLLFGVCVVSKGAEKTRFLLRNDRNC